MASRERRVKYMLLSSGSTAFRSSRRSKGPAGIAGNERGVALILALVMLVILTILGAMVLDTSSTDLKIAGNFKNTQSAFYCADAAVGYVTNANTLMSAFSSTAGFVSGLTWTSPVVTMSTCSFQANTVFVKQGTLPGGAVYDQDLTQMDPITGRSLPRFFGLYFAVNSNGTAAMNSAVLVKAGVAQVVGN
jgi:hypothetical protein